uniref:Uncharacterized protein n=1 Tax=Octopus bimaculoides TaxID=37653 RepID=A0A0L8FFT4_OCTBM
MIQPRKLWWCANRHSLLQTWHIIYNHIYALLHTPLDCCHSNTFSPTLFVCNVDGSKNHRCFFFINLRTKRREGREGER